MTIIQAIATIITVLVVPYVVQLIKHGALTGNKARWAALCVSVIAGIVCGFVDGIPTTIAGWLVSVFATVGGIQAAYTLYKSVGITSKWLDALSDVSVSNAD